MSELPQGNDHVGHPGGMFNQRNIQSPTSEKRSAERRNHFKHRLHPANLPAFTRAKRIGSRPFPKTDISNRLLVRKSVSRAPARARAIPRLDRPASSQASPRRR